MQIEATYKNMLTGFSSVIVPSFPDDYRVTPVYAPPTFTWDGAQYNSQWFLNANGAVVNMYLEGFKTAERCEITEEMPTRVYMNNTGLFVYGYSDLYAYMFNANTCEEFEIPIPSSQTPMWGSRAFHPRTGFAQAIPRRCRC